LRRYRNSLTRSLSHRGKGNRLRVAAALYVIVALACGGISGLAHETHEHARLPKIGPAPEFTLTNQEGTGLSLHQLRGKVVAVTFIYASCVDTCPLLTHKLVTLKRRLRLDEGAHVFFAAITVDPERDTPAALKRYATAHGADSGGWAFLTGTPEEIRAVARRYGVYYKKQPRGDVDHTFLTSLVDRTGMLRVQYLGVQFDPDEFLEDLRSLVREGSGR
jgi:protein SCO1